MFFPGLEKHYGANLPADITYEVQHINNVKIHEQDESISAVLSVDCTLWVHTANGTVEPAANISITELRADL